MESYYQKLPVINQWQVIKTLEKRILEVAKAEHPDIIHAHSPALNGVAAIRAGRKLGLPVVYEVRGFWEDAAVSHGTSTENGLRYRITRSMETWALKNADASICICEGIRGDLISRGIFGLIRHPMYSSLLLLGWGAFTKDITVAGTLLALATTAAVIATARVEERENLDFFGERYREYMGRTKLFIPFVY
jgi:hypothetical protein